MSILLLPSEADLEYSASSWWPLGSLCKKAVAGVSQAVNKMISSMSYSPRPEIFARSLRHRLQNLAPASDDADVNDEELSSQARRAHSCSPLPDQHHQLINQMQQHMDLTGQGDRLASFLEKGICNARDDFLERLGHQSLLGTTFPPRNVFTNDLFKAKFHSESDLLPNGLFSAKLPLHNGACKPIEASIKSVENNDSDLFFDFDIGSPEEEQREQEALVINEAHSDPDSQSSGSPTILVTLPTSPISTEPSTAYGSSSSGLFSVAEKLCIAEADEQRPDTDSEGLSLHPHEWAQRVVAPLEPALPEAMTGGFYFNGDDDDDDEDELEKNREVSEIIIGTTTKSVANSKLQALLVQLEQSSCDSFNQQGQMNVEKPVKEAAHFDAEQLAVQDEPSEASSSSAANFSSLVGSVPVQKCTIKVPLASRCASTPDMSELDKTRVMESSSFLSLDKMRTQAETFDACIEAAAADKEKKKEKYRKCSSLRSGKTPPGTPGRRKIVRFADVFGLDLADVKTFLDEVPRVPKSAFKDLKDAELSDLDSDSGSERQFPVQPPAGPPPSLPIYSGTRFTLAPLFNQPSGSSEFFNHLRNSKVCLESAYMSDLNTIKGTVRVVNLDYHKQVFIKFTFDEWQSSTEVAAVYMPGSCDGFSDKFSFSLDFSCIADKIGKRLQFCIRFLCASNDYWDSNHGKNYIFQVFGDRPQSFPSAAITIRPKCVGSSSGSHHHHHHQHHHHQQLHMSHSPTAMQDDPWLRYL